MASCDSGLFWLQSVLDDGVSAVRKNVGGLLWHFLERPRARAVAITPLVGPRAIGLTAGIHF
jgi:hypothetical protein